MPALTLARGPGGGFGFESGKALLEVAQDHVAGHNATSRQISVALGKGFKPSGGCDVRGRSVVHKEIVSRPGPAFQS
jgi:hypothetical protein